MISPNQLEKYRKNGFFVTEPQFNSQMLSKISLEFDRIQQIGKIKAANDPDHSRIVEANSRFFQWQVQDVSNVIAGMINNPIYLDVCQTFIGDDADLFTGLAAIKVAFTGKSFPWHQDAIYAVTDPITSVTCWTAIDKATLDNGCLWVIPGSHLMGLRQHEFNSINIATAELNSAQKKSAIPIEMEPGQVAVFSSLLIHMTGPNTSHNHRRSTVFQFHIANVVLALTREKCGDQFPVLRKGKSKLMNFSLGLK